MKRNYLYIECDKVLDCSSRFYKVPIGASKRDDKALLALTAISVDRGHYFHLWDSATSDFYTKCVESLGGGVTNMQCEHSMIVTKPRDLIKHLKDGTPVDSPLHVERNRDHLLKQLSLNYRVLRARK